MNNNNISLITCCNNIFFDKVLDCFQDCFENNKDIIRYILYLFGDKPASLNVPDGYCKVWREFQTESKPASWLVWPYSRSKGWADQIIGYL